MTADVTPLGFIPEWTTADRLRRVRRSMAMKQPDFAKLLGVSPSTYSAWETGRNTPDDLVGLAVKLEQVSGVPRQWFLGWMDTPGPGAGQGDDGGRSRVRTGDLPGGNPVVWLQAVA